MAGGDRPVRAARYNKFTTLEEAIKAQWAQVQNQIQRRNDLIPNLVESVRATRPTRSRCSRKLPTRARSCSAAKSPEETIEASNQQSARSAPARGGRELSESQGQRTVQSADGRTGRHREPAGDRADAVQRAIPGIQHARRRFPSNVTAKMFSFKEYPYSTRRPKRRRSRRSTSESDVRDFVAFST